MDACAFIMFGAVYGGGSRATDGAARAATGFFLLHAPSRMRFGLYAFFRSVRLSRVGRSQDGIPAALLVHCCSRRVV
jgi:alkanesulfonate monooxygenase SsuD/methylene tetrahydromethanopterin reductase-like flavin-dependent oxidoreductase (luciferase family)